MAFRDRTVSITIGSLSVKVAQLTERRGRVRTVACAEEALPAGYRWEPGADRGPLVQAVRRALARAGIRARRAIIAIPRRQVTARISAFPQAEKGQLRNVIQYDITDHIPFPVEQVVVDFQPLGTARDEPGMTDVLVVAAQRELVQDYLAVARDLRLHAVALTVDALALHDLVQLAGAEPGITLAIEVEARATAINVSEGERLRLTRSVGIGGEHLTHAIRDDLGLSPEEAHRVRLEEGLRVLSREPRPRRVAAWLENLKGEVQRSALTFGRAAVSRVLLTGRDATMPGLKEAIAAEFGVEPSVLSVHELFPEAALLADDGEVANRCLLSIAQSLQATGRSAWTVSLVPPEVVAARRALQRRRTGVLVGAATVAALLVAYSLAARSIGRHEMTIKRLERDVAAAEDQRRIGELLLAQRDELREAMEVLRTPLRHRYMALELLRSLTMYAPREAVLTRFTLEPGRPLVITGNASSSAAAADVQARLAQSSLVTEALLDEVRRTTSGRGSTRSESGVGFTISAHLFTEDEQQTRSSPVSAWGSVR